MLQREINDLKEWAESDREEIPFAKTGPREAELNSPTEQRETQADKRQRELAEVQERIDVLESRQREIRLQMFVP